MTKPSEQGGFVFGNSSAIYYFWEVGSSSPPLLRIGRWLSLPSLQSTILKGLGLPSPLLAICVRVSAVFPTYRHFAERGQLGNRVLTRRFINITLSSMERFPETLRSEAFDIYLYCRCEYGLIDCLDWWALIYCRLTPNQIDLKNS